MTRMLEVDRLLFAVHDMGWEHVERWMATPLKDWPPVWVEELPGDWWFVHDGRHRATAAYEAGHRHVQVQLV